MEKIVSAAEANRRFSKLLRRVREGQSYVVTSHGKAVSKIVPVEKNGGVTRGARAALLKGLRSEPVATLGWWSRDELYERDAVFFFRKTCRKASRGRESRSRTTF